MGQDTQDKYVDTAYGPSGAATVLTAPIQIRMLSYAVAMCRPVCLIEGIYLSRSSQHPLGVYQRATVRVLPP